MKAIVFGVVSVVIGLASLPAQAQVELRDPAKSFVQRFESSLCFVRLRPDVRSGYRTIGDSSWVVPIVRVRTQGNTGSKEGQSLAITSEFALRGQAIEVLSKGCEGATVVHQDRHAGLAALSVPGEQEGLRVEHPVVSQVVYVVVWDVVHKEARLHPVALGAKGEGALAYYTSVTTSAPVGSPLVGSEGSWVGVIGLRDSEGRAWVLLGGDAEGVLQSVGEKGGGGPRVQREKVDLVRGFR